MMNVVKLSAAFAIVAALLLGGSFLAYKAYLNNQIGHANPSADANPRPESTSPGAAPAVEAAPSTPAVEGK